MFDVNPILLKLKEIPNLTAIVVGGSHATGTNRPDSDIDLGIYYKEESPFDIKSIQKLAAKLNDTPNPIVSDFDGWGRWVNGGTWLTIKNQRLDFIYRNINFVEQTIDDCINGEIESDYYQEPPSGFHSFIYCAETKSCKILYDPEGIILELKRKVKIYPPKLKEKIINTSLWDAEFSLSRAKGFASRNEISLVASSATRITHDLIQVIYALNNKYFMSVKKTYKDIPQFGIVPNNFIEQVEKGLGNIGTSSTFLSETLQKFSQLIEECKLLAKDIYVPKYK